MYSQQFPNIDWIRKTSQQDFSSQRDYLGNPLPTNGWPNVILNVKSSLTERDGIKGPFSLFYNLEGKSRVGLNNEWHQVSSNFYCLSNSGQLFNLHIDDDQLTQTFNIHFGHSLFEDLLQQLTQKEEWNLDNFSNVRIPAFEILPRTDFMHDELRSKIRILHQYAQLHQEDYSQDKEYELTGSILEQLLLQQAKKLHNIDQIGSLKASTREELFRRINIGLDYIHSNELINLNLDKVSMASGLSKFHFIRVFKEIHGKSPSDYISELKVKKAKSLLSDTKRDLLGISTELGFSELSAFTRFFKRMTGQPPSFAR